MAKRRSGLETQRHCPARCHSLLNLMIVCSLRLINFRNYATQDVEFPPGLVALTGDNGQGKTNLLEAVCVLAATKSPLVDRDRELIRWDQKDARITAEIELDRRGERRV